jgi:2-keto-4-pentenoate hydratase
MGDIERIAEVLREAEASRVAVGPVSDLVAGGLSLDDAHGVAESNIARREAQGERIVGYKIGFTNLAAREKMGLPDSTYGYLMDGMILGSGGEIDMSAMVAPKIESEICVRMARDLVGPDVGADDVMAAADAVRATFEICDARIIDWKCPYPDFFADNGFSARVVLGALDWQPVGDIDLLDERVVLAKDGEAIAEGQGVLAMGGPAHAVAWLANRLSERGRRLEAGQLVMTGTLTPITPIEAGAHYSATFTSLGRVETSFVRGRSA